MKRILVAIECLDYNYIQQVQPPNILSLDPHPALAWGLGSRPSAAALMGGMLPICQYPECFHRTIKDNWSNPFFLTSVDELVQETYYLVANGWIIELLLPWMSLEQRKLNLDWHDRHIELPAREMTDYFLKDVKGVESFFAYLHFFESHWPFYGPNGTGDREAAVLFLDNQVGRILDACSDSEVVLTTDHNIPPKKVSAAHDVPAPQTLLAFIATNFKKTPTWAELGVDPVKAAKERWTRVQYRE